MKILEVKKLEFPEVKVIRFQRFKDERGYFAEIYRQDQFHDHPELTDLKTESFVQYNESYSMKGTIRGALSMESEWKVDKTVGHMVVCLDIALVLQPEDVAYDMPFDPN